MVIDDRIARVLREGKSLPGLLANEEMAERSNPALSKPATGRSLFEFSAHKNPA